MKRIAGVIAFAFAAIITSCGGEAKPEEVSPFVGRIEFKASGMGMSTNGSLTMDAENERMTYRIDALEAFMGSDVAMMVDMKKKMIYTISPSKGIYAETPMKEEDVKGELPTKKEVEELKEEFFSKLEKTGKTKEISGITCEEYILKEKAEDIESATIWINKELLDRMTMNLEIMKEFKKLGAEEMMIGFPMQASVKSDGKTGSFEVTKITEGKDALSDFDLSKMKKLSQFEFSMKLMENSGLGEYLEGLEDMDLEGVESFEDLGKLMEDMK